MPTNRNTLLEEYRLIERSEHEVNGAWKGAHILLFFLAFVFGSFCTFCFHMLMYMFDEKCVLFPKLQSLTSLRHNVIYEFIPSDKEAADMPVDFLSTQWVEKSVCYLPTYVPLVSGIFGLVWTTMFLMCSTGSRTLTGLQRPWRILPPVFIFSVAMSGLCVYYSAITQYGLEELCLKLSEITGSPTCTYTVNVATLVYERRIRGVYQATRLTILSAWLHTSCWILSAVLALVRVIMVVDFQLVRINVELIGDIDKMLQNQETHIRTVSPDRMIFKYSGETLSSDESVPGGNNKVQFKNKQMNTDTTSMMCMIHYKGASSYHSELSLLPEEKVKFISSETPELIDKKHHFIAELVADLVDNLSLSSDSGAESPPSLVMEVVRQYGQSKIKSLLDEEVLHSEGEEEGLDVNNKKSNLKHVSIQTDKKRKRVASRKSIKQKVRLSEPKVTNPEDSDPDKSKNTANKESQTPEKEKQD